MINLSRKLSFAQLWRICIYNFMYDVPRYVHDIEKIFNKNNLIKYSKILDSCAGVGFPAIEITKKGYKIDCMDATEDEIIEFKDNARKQNVDLTCKKLKWSEIPEQYPRNHYDFIFCRGNSFIYAPGGWNEYKKVNKKESLKEYKKTLKIFYSILKEGGILYLDKFSDREKPGRVKIGEVKFGEREYDLFFYREMKEGYREAAMILVDENGNEEGLLNIAYSLRFNEVISMMKEVGFKKIQKIKLKSEEYFDIILAYK